ncbi:acyl-CoA reductase-like NAD-dependent aldehyde dehydrogenase [Actinomycetospora succinea]|uniref:Acyl-CoA reductase-like NAD-dependent aldehyde dehydrogenase n=1 Tax=Actinomycetospora succinea TaxID=663603 RepID=A0A4R6VGQ1_9PSEU|nr:aldehyde dehydrogenase family protein [Actinomycetospora succinea]TDQ62377.1 acyl-CoA reductase-like NAD-dependent aldehyde dehydrogenase [Actinomycetospora succinea]
MNDTTMLIGGKLRPASDGSVLDALNPATGVRLTTIPDATPGDVDDAVAAASSAFATWRRSTPGERSALLTTLADVVAAHADELARLDADDNGSLYREMRRDVDMAVFYLRYYAGLTLQLHGDTVPSEPGTLTYSVRRPYGVVGRLIPFNHPLMFAASKIAAPLAAGNTVVIKPSEHTSLSALRLGELAADVVPPGVLNVVTGTGARSGDALVAHPDVRRLAFTGSAATGRAIQRRAAEVSIKTVTLELGGKNPLVVFPDADLDVAVAASVRGMNFTWQGQSCGSLSRVVVHRDVHDAFVEKLAATVGALRPGLPDDPDADTGAIVNAGQLEKVLSYVRLGQDEGARLCTGGDRVTEGGLADGLFVRPAVFADVDPGSRLAQEEIFGPVLAVMRPFTDADEALRIANATSLGLTASVFTRDLGTAHRFAEDLEAGYVWVNEVGRHVPGTPFGGVKDSGIGREEDLDELFSYTQLKNVHINYGHI